jgi:hypothetical protein
VEITPKKNGSLVDHLPMFSEVGPKLHNLCTNFAVLIVEGHLDLVRMHGLGGMGPAEYEVQFNLE